MNKAFFWKMRTVRRRVSAFLVVLLTVLLLCPVAVMAATGYKSWVRGTPEYDAAYSADAMPTEGIEAGAEVVDKINSHPNDTDPDTTEKMWSKILVGWGTGISKALKGGTIDASITGITMGKLVNGVNYFVFDLTDQNPYGTVGSIIYVTFRHICLSIIFIFALWKIVTGGIFSDRGFGELKGAAYSLIIFLVLLYCMPLVVDWVCELRDFMSKEIFLSLGSVVTGHSDGLKSTLSLEDEYLEIYNASRTTLDALIYFAMCITPVMYFFSYLKIALTVLTMFGLFPLFATVAVRDPKQLTNWCSIMFSNLFVPMVDLLILLIPSLIITIIESVAGSLEGSTLKAVLVVMMLINAIGARELVLRMFGNSLGISGGLGAVGAAGAIAGMAKRAFGAAKDALGVGGDGSRDDGGMDKDEADDRDAEAAKDLKDTRDSLNEIKGSRDESMGDGSGMGGSDEDEQKGLDEIRPLQGNEIGAFQAGEEEGEAEQDGDDGDDGEDGGRALYTGDELEEIPGTGEYEVPEGAMDYEPDDVDGVESGTRFIDEYGVGDDASELTGVQADGDIGGELTSGDQELSQIDPSMPESGIGGKEEYSGAYVPDGDNVTSAPASGGDLAGREEVAYRIEGAAGGEDGYATGYNVEGGEPGERDNESPENPLDSMRREQATPEQISNVQSEADKAIADATVTKDDLERSTGGETGRIGNIVKENSPESKGANKELDRQLNLTRAANLQTLDNLKAKSEMLDKDNAAAQHTIASNNSLITANAAKLSDLDRREQSIYDKYGGKEHFPSNSNEVGHMLDRENLENISRQREQLESSSRNAEQSVQAAKSRIAGNSAVKQHLSSEIARRQGTEAELAGIQEKRGMSGRTYSSTKEFTRQLEHDNNIRKTMSYKNFTNEKYSGVLTSQERAQFQRQQNIRRAVSATARFTGNVVGGAAMTVAGASAMVALSGMGRDGVQIGADIMATGVGKMAAGGGQVVNAGSRFIKDTTAEAATQAVYHAPGAARAVKDKYDAYNERWAAHQEELMKPNEKKPMVTRRELEERRAKAGAVTPQRNPKDVPFRDITGLEEARMFNEQRSAGKDDPVVQERARQAEEAARKAQQDYEKRSRNAPPLPPE